MTGDTLIIIIQIVHTKGHFHNFDMETRTSEKTYATFGFKDEHTTVGEYYTEQITGSHKGTNNTK